MRTSLLQRAGRAAQTATTRRAARARVREAQRAPTHEVRGGKLLAPRHSDAHALGTRTSQTQTQTYALRKTMHAKHAISAHDETGHRAYAISPRRVSRI